jgi:phospholipid/cholesterol/gamma-HCH transport system substrate-binding protein
MNERVMQFRIGMFVIVAGLVLTMLIVWFGESPALFRDNAYLTVHFTEAPGVAVGIPVRKSGIRVGEVAEIEFDQRPGQGDGVLVTLALERKYRLRAGSVPRLSRALIGDVSIDLLPGPGPDMMQLSANPALSKQSDRIVEGEVTPDPSKALAAATQAFEKVGGTLTSIDRAAQGLAKVTDSAENLDTFLTTWDATGKKLGTLSDDIQRVLQTNEEEIQGTIASLNQAASKVNATLDEPTQENLRVSARKLADATARIDRVLEQLGPLAADLGAPAGGGATTNGGQVLMRVNRIAYELGLLTAQLPDPSGRRLNPNGSLQRLVMDAALYNNLNKAALSVTDVFTAARPIMRNLSEFAERVARDPGAIGRGALSRE